MSENSVPKTKMKKIGKIKEAHGIKGDVYVLVFSKDVSWLPKLKKIGLKNVKTEEKKSCEVLRGKPFKDGVILALSAWKDRNGAEAHEGFEVYIPEDLLVSQKGETIFLNEILNFELYDGENLLGPIQGFSTNGVQDILLVEKSGYKNKIEVPFVDAFLKRIDFENKSVYMELPEGLVDVNESTSEKIEG